MPAWAADYDGGVTQTDVDRTAQACRDDYRACKVQDAVAAQFAAQEEERRVADQVRKKEERHRRQREAEEAIAAKRAADEEQLRKLCGKDAHLVRVGMKIERVAQCSGYDVVIRSEDLKGADYDLREREGVGAGVGTAHVERGIVVRWHAP